MKLTKQVIALGLASAMVVGMTGCGGNGGQTTATQAKSNETGSTQVAQESDIPSFLDLKVGEDYTDLQADLKFITHRTDLIDETFQSYIAEFQTLYPGINITYEGITAYADEMMTRLTTGNWGDICMLPMQVDKAELENYFISYGDKTELDKSYIMLNDYSYRGQTYGIPSVGNAQGVLYNKKVFAEAGITELPKTPDEFLDVLQQIKDKTDVAAPLYTNFAAGWTMTAWGAYISGSATGDADFKNNTLNHSENPFTKKDDLTGPYAVYYTLYEAVARDLIEDDPTTTDWEGSKVMLNNGEIGCMVLGSWAIAQMQEAGPNPDDIGYMTFPITIDGKQYATASPDYNYAININSSDDNKIAAMLYIKWLTEDSNFAYDQGSIPICVGAEYPDAYKAFDGVELVINNAAPEGEESLFDDINNYSEVGIETSPDGPSRILEAAINGSPSLDDIMDDWNQRWSKAQEKYGAR